MKIKIGEDGKTIYNAETNESIGVMENGRMILSAEAQKKMDEENNNALKFNQNVVKEKESVKEKVEKKTKYEVSKDTTFKISFGLVGVDDRFIIIPEDSVQYTPNAEPVWVKFRMWTYVEELQWKEECTEYNEHSKMQFININKLNEIKIKKLILDWSFGEIDDKFKLLHTDGKLSDESYSVFCGLLPNIANAIVNLMNDVLENNK